MVIANTGLCGVTSTFGFYLDSTRQLYIQRLRFPDSNAHKLKKYIFYYKLYNALIIAPIGVWMNHGRQEFIVL